MAHLRFEIAGQPRDLRAEIRYRQKICACSSYRPRSTNRPVWGKLRMARYVGWGRVMRLTNSTSDDEYGSTQLNHAIAGRTLMSDINLAGMRNVFGAVFIAAALFVAAIAGPLPGHAAGACALIPNEKTPSEKILQCDGAEGLTVRAAQGTRYRMLYKKGDPLPAGIRLDDGALLIEFQPSLRRQDFQILTPLAVAAVRGTKWAVEVTKARTSVLVLSDTVGVTNRRLNQYVILSEGEGVDITPADTSTVQKTWGEARKRALLARFGE
jgi:hypothetical protein